MLRWLLSILMISVSLSCGAATDYCSGLSGQWVGHYQDIQGLYPPSPVGVQLVLEYEQGQVYGYTLSSAGPLNTALIWGQCQHHTLSQLYLLPAGQHCTSPQAIAAEITNPNQMSLLAHWENAMANSSFKFQLKRDTLPYTTKVELIQNAKNLSHQNLSTCH